MQQKYAYTPKTVLEEWANNYASTRTWLSKLNGTKKLRALDLFYFCDWANLNPDELLSLKSSFESLDAERSLDRFVAEATEIPDSLRWKSTIAVRSFFRCNYRQLQSEAGKMEYVQQKPQRSPRKAQRLELFKACYNQRDRTLVCVTCCSAIALETLSKLRWYHFEEDWERQGIPHISIPPELLKGHGKGKYKGIRQETFLTPEAKHELLKYRDWMMKQFSYMWNDNDFVFLSIEKPYTPLTYNGLANTILTISERANVPFSVHDGRRIVETALENTSTPRNWIQKVKGRKVRGEDAPYSKPAIEQLRAKYKEALSELEFLSEQNVGLKKLEELEKKAGEKDQVIEMLSQNVEVLTQSLTSFKRQVFRRDHDLPLNTSDEEIDQAMAAEEKDLNLLRKAGYVVRVQKDGSFDRPPRKP
jgi:hypothetical protein